MGFDAPEIRLLSDSPFCSYVLKQPVGKGSTCASNVCRCWNSWGHVNSPAWSSSWRWHSHHRHWIPSLWAWSTCGYLIDISSSLICSFKFLIKCIGTDKFLTLRGVRRIPRKFCSSVWQFSCFVIGFWSLT